MSTASRHSADRAPLTCDGSANLGGATARCSPGILTLDELLAEPMVQQLMCRDRTDEMAVRRLWEHVAGSRPAQTPRSMLPVPVTADELGHLLHATARLWRKRCERAVRARLPGMTCAQCAVLLELDQPEGLNQVTLAHILEVTPMTLVRLLDRLETAGLVSRLPDPHDRRAYLLTPTAKARPLIACIHDIIKTIQSEAWFGLSDTETNQLHTLLCPIRSNLLIGTNQPLAADPARNSEHA
jgi:MarR family transcriptional regulator, transcriptional regulator for hemolysin